MDKGTVSIPAILQTSETFVKIFRSLLATSSLFNFKRYDNQTWPFDVLKVLFLAACQWIVIQ